MAIISLFTRNLFLKKIKQHPPGLSLKWLTTDCFARWSSIYFSCVHNASASSIYSALGNGRNYLNRKYFHFIYMLSCCLLYEILCLTWNLKDNDMLPASQISENLLNSFAMVCLNTIEYSHELETLCELFQD